MAIILVVLTLTVFQSRAQSDFDFRIEGNVAVITGYRGASGAVVIPDSLGGKLVTSIDSRAFHGKTRLTSVTIPNSVAIIGESAFSGCTSLTSITIPKSVISIGYGAFYGCTAMLAIAVDPLSRHYKSVDGVLFSKDQTVLFLYPGGRAGAYTIPSRVTGIQIGAFSGCSGLTSVTIPNSVIGIGYGAFSGCTGLTSLTLPSSVTTIMEQAFYGCTRLASVEIPYGVAAIGGLVFYGCTGLTSITIPNSVVSIGYGAFYGCTAMLAIAVDPLSRHYKSVDGVLFDIHQTSLLAYPGGKAGAYTIPDSVTIIGNVAFGGCTGLTSVTIPNSVNSIWHYAFADCTGLASVTIGNNVTYIVNGAFYGCTGLTSVMIPNSVASIGDRAFYGCTGLKSVMIPNSVTSIWDWAFYGCTSLTSVTIPNNVTSIGYGAFYSCTDLTSLYFEGNAPSAERLFDFSPFVTVFYRSEAKGWGPSFSDRPTAVWTPLPAYADWANVIGLMAQYPTTSGESDDPDADGVTNRDEWLAGTDPTQRASRIELEHVPRPADLAESDRTPISAGSHPVYFRSVPGRRYGVKRAISLQNTWELQAVTTASASQTRFVLPNPEPMGFYRVLALP